MSSEYIGKSVQRKRIYEKVTGKQLYSADRKLADCLYVKLIRSPYAHAKIIDIDYSAALEIKGLIDILSYLNFSQGIPRFGSVEMDQPILADEYVKYHGEPVVAVVATNQKIAEAASKLVKISYEELQSITSFNNIFTDNTIMKNQLYKEHHYGWGDIKEKSHFELFNTFTYPIVYHFPIENYTCLIEPEEDCINVYTPIQHPFILRRMLSETFNLSMSKIRVIAEEIGGGFGGKGYAKIEPLATYIALKHKKSVRITLSMKEGFFSTRRLTSSISIRTGFNEEGKILYQEIDGNYLMGAYLDAAPRVVAKSSYICCGPYKIPFTRMVAKAFYSNTVPCTAFRGFGMPQIMFAIESQMNIAASELGIDAYKIREVNLPDKGDIFIPGDKPCDGDWKEVLKKAADIINWNIPTKSGVGKSISLGIKSGIHGSVSNAIIRLHSDGSVTGFCGTTDMGQGSRTVFAQLIAERLKIDINSVKIVLGDTELTPFDLSTAGSRSTVSMGTAIINACDDILNQIQELIFSDEKNKDVDLTHVKSGYLINECKKSYLEILEDYFGKFQGEIIGRGRFIGKKVIDHPLGGHADFWEFIAMASNVDVDQNTGEVTPNSIAIVSDVGKIINTELAHGQENGGFVMSLGQALFEEVVYSENGNMLNGNPIDYKVPSIKDINYKLKSEFVENNDGPGPYGSKGLGESSAIPVGALIAGAVYNSTGIYIKDLPITKEKLFFKLKDYNDKK